MKDLIKKILKEGMRISPDAPDWVEKFHNLPKEERIEFIENNKKRIEKLTPVIIKFFKEKYGNSLDRIDVGEHKTYYGSEGHSMNEVQYKFYFNKINIDNNPIIQEIDRHQIIKYLKDYFDIHLEFYGVPLSLKFFVKTWREF
jgi:uncharacterized protein YbcC (UPF0753/DUF2309 family)